MAISHTLHSIIVLADDTRWRRRPRANNTSPRGRRMSSLSICYKCLSNLGQPVRMKFIPYSESLAIGLSLTGPSSFPRISILIFEFSCIANCKTNGPIPATTQFISLSKKPNSWYCRSRMEVRSVNHKPIFRRPLAYQISPSAIPINFSCERADSSDSNDQTFPVKQADNSHSPPALSTAPPC